MIIIDSSLFNSTLKVIIIAISVGTVTVVNLNGNKLDPTRR